MTKMLYFHTEEEAELKKVKVKDGEIIVGDKKFDLGDSISIKLRKPMGMVEPLYLLKWDCIRPGEFSHHVLNRKEEFAAIKNEISGNPDPVPFGKNIITNVVFTHFEKTTPESLFKSESLKIAGGLFRVKKGGGGIAPIIFGVVMGAVVVFMLFYFKLLKL